MDKLFGTSKPKVVAPKVDINAPTLTETSAKVSIKHLLKRRWTSVAR